MNQKQHPSRKKEFEFLAVAMTVFFMLDCCGGLGSKPLFPTSSDQLALGTTTTVRIQEETIPATLAVAVPVKQNETGVYPQTLAHKSLHQTVSTLPKTVKPALTVKVPVEPAVEALPEIAMTSLPEVLGTAPLELDGRVEQIQVNFARNVKLVPVSCTGIVIPVTVATNEPPKPRLAGRFSLQRLANEITRVSKGLIKIQLSERKIGQVEVKADFSKISANFTIPVDSDFELNPDWDLKEPESGATATAE